MTHFYCTHMSLVVRKPGFCICENKAADQLSSNCTPDKCLCHRYMDSTVPPYLNPKVQNSSYLKWLYSPVCVRPCRKPRRPVSSLRGSYNYMYVHWIIFIMSTFLISTINCYQYSAVFFQLHFYIYSITLTCLCGIFQFCGCKT